MPVLGEQTSENRNAFLLESKELTDEADKEIKDVSRDGKELEINGDDVSSDKRK